LRVLKPPPIVVCYFHWDKYRNDFWFWKHFLKFFIQNLNSLSFRQHSPRKDIQPKQIKSLR
jgi:hypothetical protein